MCAHKKLIFCTFCLLALAQLTNGQDPDVSDISTTDYWHIKQKREISVEFLEYFEKTRNPNITLPNQEDLKCLEDLSALSTALTENKLWAMRFIDAWGTIPSGILDGNVKDLGNYDECLKINKEIYPDYHIKGKYCLAKLPFGRTGISMFTAVCLPASCTAERMDIVLKAFLKQIFKVSISSGVVQESSCQTCVRVPLSGWAVVTIIILSALATLVVVSTFYDYFFAIAGTQLHPAVRAFSAYTNGRQLFRIVTESNPNVVSCLHGMRCMSLMWVVYGHCYLLAIQAPNINSFHMLKWAAAPFTSFIHQGVYSVDTFFFISGLLVAMLALRQMERTKGKLNVPLMYLHRFLRLTPLVAMAILIYSSLLQHFGDGPLWGAISFDNYKFCKRNWWATLLYVQNYAVKDVCLGPTWYLSVDMQLYILSPIFLMALWKFGNKAVVGIVVLILLLSACLFSMIMLKHYSLFYKHVIGNTDSQRKIYYSTHTRAAPWLIGIIFGYFLHKSNGKSFNLSTLWVWLGWIVALGLIFTSIFALYPKSKWSALELTSLQEAFYLTLTRIAWPLALCWVVFACQYGYGGFANSFLSSPLWQPLSKLSFCTYLFHSFIENLNGRRIRTNTFFSDYDVMLKFWGDFGFTLLLSTLLYLLIEAPMAGMEIMLLPSRRPTSRPAANTANNKCLKDASAADKPPHNFASSEKEAIRLAPTETTEAQPNHTSSS